jgi:hypothetical protein
MLIMRRLCFGAALPLTRHFHHAKVVEGYLT